MLYLFDVNVSKFLYLVFNFYYFFVCYQIILLTSALYNVTVALRYKVAFL